MTEAEDFYSSFIANCVFNAFSCYTTIMLNIITIHAIRKASSLPKPLRTLLLSLAVSDLGVGLLVQPLYIGVLVMMLEPNAENNTTFKTTKAVSASIATFFCYPSIFGVTALSAERFLAIHLHLRYKELVTHKRVVAVVILIWLFSAFLSSLDLWLPSGTELIYAVLDSACLVTSAILYCKIYAVVRHHMNEIRAQKVRQDAQNGEMVGTLARLRKSAVGTFYIYLLFIICYLPNTCIYIAATISGATAVIKGVSRYTFTLVLVNSSLNPLIYCWKMKDVRHVIMDMLRNKFRRK